MKKVIKHRFDVWQEEPLYWDLMFLIVRIAASEEIMGKFKSGWLSKALLWFTFH